MGRVTKDKTLWEELQKTEYYRKSYKRQNIMGRVAKDRLLWEELQKRILWEGLQKTEHYGNPWLPKI